MYSQKVMEHFKHPHNLKKIKNPDGIGKVGNLICGDVMKVYIKVASKKGKDYIKDIKFETIGCVAAISSSSVVTELAKGQLLDKAIKITNKDVLKKLGSLPEIKYHCSLLAEQALSEAVYNYLKKNNLLGSVELQYDTIEESFMEFLPRFKKFLGGLDASKKKLIIAPPASYSTFKKLAGRIGNIFVENMRRSNLASHNYLFQFFSF